MKISVVIPFYNNYSTISKTLDSLVKQTQPVFEVIIVDDNSENKIKAENSINYFNSKLPIKLIRNEENKNGAFSRNRGILASKGEIIAFLDADDTWAPNKTLRIKESVNKYGVDNLFFSKVKIEVDGESQYSRPNKFNPKVHISEYLFLEDGFIQTSSIFCSSNIAKEVLFQEKFKRHQDYDFVLRAYYKGVKFKFLPEELTTYKSEQSVNLSKGEAYSYSKYWVGEMRDYFTEEGYRGFQIFNLTARLIAEKKYTKAIFNLFDGLTHLNIKHYPRIYPKFIKGIKRVLKIKES